MKKDWYCTRDYSRVKPLPFNGVAYHITVSGGDDFKRIADQSDRDYRKVFNYLTEIAKNVCKDKDVNNYNGYHFAMCGGTSFTHGSAKKGGTYSEPIGKMHLHLLLYTNCNMLAGISKNNDTCLGGELEKRFKNTHKGFSQGFKVKVIRDREVIDYCLQQRIEPKPLWYCDVKNTHYKSILKTISDKKECSKGYKKKLSDWDNNMTIASEKLLKSKFVYWLPIKGLNPIPLRLLGKVTFFDQHGIPYITTGILEAILEQKVVELVITKHRKRHTVEADIQGGVDSLCNTLKNQPLMVCYLYREYYNNILRDRVNKFTKKKLGKEILKPLITYTRKVDGKRETITREAIDFRTREGKELKKEGYK